MYPTARQEGILAHEINEELVIYDQERHLAHRLNRTAALVWRHCDGRTPVAEIAQVLGAKAGPAEEELVHWALDELRGANLLFEATRPATMISRRAAMQRIARVAGIALIPVVTSIVAPTPADAQSGNGGRGHNGSQNKSQNRSRGKSARRGKK